MRKRFTGAATHTHSWGGGRSMEPRRVARRVARLMLPFEAFPLAAWSLLLCVLSLCSADPVWLTYLIVFVRLSYNSKGSGAATFVVVLLLSSACGMMTGTLGAHGSPSAWTSSNSSVL